MQHLQQADHPGEPNQTIETSQLRYLDHLNAASILLLQEQIKWYDCNHIDQEP